MSRRTILGAVAVVAVMAVAPAVLGGSDDCVVTLTATVDSFAEWSDATPTIAAGDWTGSADGTTISQVGEFLTVTKVLTLYANADVTITAAGTDNSGIATNGTDTLVTSYKITGDVVTPDGDYKGAGTGAGQFFNVGNTYAVTHVLGDGSYTINLGAKLESASDRAQDAGDYTCSITLTATW